MGWLLGRGEGAAGIFPYGPSLCLLPVRSCWLPGSVDFVGGFHADDLMAGQGPALVFGIEEGTLTDEGRLGRADGGVWGLVGR